MSNQQVEEERNVFCVQEGNGSIKLNSKTMKNDSQYSKKLILLKKKISDLKGPRGKRIITE